MDFLTRLAQRLTGDLPAVQPRLAARFEPVAGNLQPVATLADQVSSGAAESLTSASGAVTVPRPTPANTLPAQPRIAADISSPHPPTRVGETVRRAPTPPVAVSRESGAPLLGVSPDPGRRSNPQLPATRRRVPVEIRPAVITNAQQPPAVTSRRGALPATSTDDRMRLHSDRMSESSAAPSTVHVHIGRVDVRAIMPPAAPPKPAARPAASRVTLEDYLGGHKGGSQP